MGKIGEKKQRVLILFGWALSIFVLLVCFFVFSYSDLTDTLDNSVMLVESLLQGKLGSFYQYAAMNKNLGTVYSANYNILLYSLFAIWNLPTVILHLTTGFNYMNSVFAIYWCKVLIVLFIVFGDLAIFKIVNFLTNDTKKGLFSVFLYTFSSITMMSSFIALQYDCIELAIILWAIYYLIKGKSNTCFCLLALAVPFKVFSLFAIVPLALLHTKNILKTTLITCLSILPLVILEIPFIGNEYYTMAIGSQASDALDLISGSGNVAGVLNLFIISMATLCLYCLLCKPENKNDKSYVSIYVVFCVFTAFVSFVSIRSYWAILFVPFLSVLISIHPRPNTAMYFLEVLTGFSGTLYFLIHHWIYGTNNMVRSLILRGIVPEPGYQYEFGSFYDMCRVTGLSRYENLIVTVFVAGLLLLTYLLRPTRSEKCFDEESGNIALSVLGHSLINALVIVMLFYGAFKTVPTICSNLENVTISDQKTSEIDKDGVVKPITFRWSTDIHRFEMPITFRGYNRASRALVQVELLNDTDKVIWKDIYAFTRNSDLLQINIDSVEVTTECNYKVKLTTINEELSYGMKAFGYTDNNNEIICWFR